MSGQMFFGSSPGIHGPIEHTNRVLRHFFMADRFQSQTAGVFQVVASLPAWELTNATDVLITAGLELPAEIERVTGTLSIDTIYVLQDAAAIGAGNARAGLSHRLIQSLDNPLAQTPAVETFAIPADGANPIVRTLSLAAPSVLAVDSLDIILNIIVRRNATDALDTYEARLRFLGVSGLITLDQ